MNLTSLCFRKRIKCLWFSQCFEKDFLELIDLVKSGKVDLEKIVTNTYNLDEADKAFQDFSKNVASMLKVVIKF